MSRHCRQPVFNTEPDKGRSDCGGCESKAPAAFQSVRDAAAVEDGIVPGGGVALINAMSTLDDLKMDYADAQIGVSIVRESMEIPMLKITSNAGKDGAVIIENVRRAQAEKNNKNIGYDVLAEDYVDMIKAGVIDPAKVTRGALENAASIAAMILTTEALITDIPADEPPMPMPGGGGGMGGMM